FGKREGPAAGEVVAVGRGRAGRERVRDRDLVGVVVLEGAAEPNRDAAGAPFGRAIAGRREGDGQRLHGGRAEQRHLVQVVPARTTRAERAEGPAVDLGQPQAVVWRAVADLLPHEVREPEPELLPAGEVVLE